MCGLGIGGVGGVESHIVVWLLDEWNVCSQSVGRRLCRYYAEIDARFEEGIIEAKNADKCRISCCRFCCQVQMFCKRIAKRKHAWDPKVICIRGWTFLPNRLSKMRAPFWYTSNCMYIRRIKTFLTNFVAKGCNLLFIDLFWPNCERKWTRGCRFVGKAME